MGNAQQVVIKTSNVTKTYKGKAAVNDVSMTIYKGDIYGFIGSNGAGKTTFIRCLMGLIAVSSGKIEILGKSDKSGLVEARKKIGCIVEGPALLRNFTALESLKTHALLYGKIDEQKIKNLLKLVGLADTNNKKIKDFSLGMRQRLAIAQALVNEPEILILDEPTNGLDPQGIAQLREFLIMLTKKHNITILISSHILPELQQLATRFGIIKDGVLIEELTNAELQAKPQANLEEYFISKVGGQSWSIS